MFYYIDQPCTPSFPIGLAKTESDFIIRSVETRLGRSTLVVAVISVDAYPFFGFLRPDLSPWRYRNKCFLVALYCLIVRRPILEVDKSAGVVLVSCCRRKCVPTAYSSGVDISEVPGYHLLWLTSSQWGSQKFLQGLVSHELKTYLSVFNLFLTQ